MKTGSLTKLSRFELIVIGLIITSLLSTNEARGVGRKGKQLFNHNSPFSLWGLDVSSAVLNDERTQQVIAALNSYAKYGINSVSLSFQPRGAGRGAFGEDGLIADQDVARRLRDISRSAVDRWMVPVITVFRSPLDSAPACEQALAEVARLLGRGWDIILNLGHVSREHDLMKFTRLLRDHGYRGLIGVELNTVSELDSPAQVSDSLAWAKACDVLFLSARPGDILPSDLLGANKPVVLTAVVEDPDRPGRAYRDLDEYIEMIARKRGLYLIARVPSCCENELPRYNLRADRTANDEGLGWYLRRVGDAQLALHGPIDMSVREPVDESALLEAGEKEEGFVSLFDGRSLKGWTLLSDSWQSFSAKDGVIMCDGSSPNAYLRTARRYSDFILRLEVKIEPRGNSGIFVRAPLWGRSSRIGFEVQIEGKPSPIPRKDSAGAIYDVLPPKLDAMRPAGEWNAFEIICRGPSVRVSINGQLVQDFNMDEIPKMRGRLREGVIGLQDHSDKVWFRKIRIKELG